MTSDLSKQLAEIKKRLNYISGAGMDHDGPSLMALLKEDHNHARRLLNIIEVEIPGMLRREAAKIMSVARELEDTKVDVAELVYAARVLNTQATLIESLTKDNANEKENG